MRKTSQANLAALFGRSQQWISKYQRRADDPMPRDLAGAREWGIRNGILAADGQLEFDQPTHSPLVAQDINLKAARTEKLQMEIAVRRGDLISREDADRARMVAAAEFRKAACEYPQRARATLERFVTDATTLDEIMRALEPLAAELLNRADPAQFVGKRSKSEIRAAVMSRAEEILSSIPEDRAHEPPPSSTR